MEARVWGHDDVADIYILAGSSMKLDGEEVEDRQSLQQGHCPLYLCFTRLISFPLYVVYPTVILACSSLVSSYTRSRVKDQLSLSFKTSPFVDFFNPFVLIYQIASGATCHYAVAVGRIRVHLFGVSLCATGLHMPQMHGVCGLLIFLKVSPIISDRAAISNARLSAIPRGSSEAEARYLIKAAHCVRLVGSLNTT
jgi:hypothetical protein